MNVASRFWRMVAAALLVSTIICPVLAKYSGGSGTADDPYRITTAADLIALGETSADYDKHFILTADIDLDPNLPGRRVFNHAVIAPHLNNENWLFMGSCFWGVFDGNNHVISRLTITGGNYLGLFGILQPVAVLKNLGIVDVNIRGSGPYVGGLVGWNSATVTNCYGSGLITGWRGVGGLVGWNEGAAVTQCYSDVAVSGESDIGGMIGTNCYGSVSNCYCTGAISATGDNVGGLLGYNELGTVTHCFSTGTVRGGSDAGGLVGYSTYDYGVAVTACFWDTQTSGQQTSAGGTGKTTADMQMAETFTGWSGCGALWTIDEGRSYPHLGWEKKTGEQVIAGPTYGGGIGTDKDPYLIFTAEQLNFIGLAPCDWDKHFKLMADIDLSGFDGKDGRPAFNIVAPGFMSEYHGFIGTPFTGTFDGNGHKISHLTGKVVLFAILGDGGQVKNLGMEDVTTIGSAPLVWYNVGRVAQCSSTGKVSGDWDVGGLVGYNLGAVTDCYSTAAVSGASIVGGLVGRNGYINLIDGSYKLEGTISYCYSTGRVSDNAGAGGLVGFNRYGSAANSFWDTQTSGQTISAGGRGKTTADLQTASAFLEAGWDFVGETANGTEDIWRIPEGKDYPHLWWESR